MLWKLSSSMPKNFKTPHEYMEQKRINHELAMKLWDEHATPILKGIDVVDKAAVEVRNLRLDAIEAEQASKHASSETFANMSKSERVKCEMSASQC